MKLRFGFNLKALLCFILIMIPNFIWMAVADTSENLGGNEYINMAQSVVQVIFAATSIGLVNNKDKPADKSSVYKKTCLIIMGCMLILYYIAWARYFMNGCDNAVMNDKLWIIPIPLAIFPTLFFLSEAMWLENAVAFISMLVFGILHCYYSYGIYLNLK